MFLLNVLLYRPIRKVLGQRRKEMDSLERAISDFDSKSESHEKELNENVIAASKEGTKEKEDIKAKGQEVEREMLQEAASSAEERIEKAKKDMNRMAEQARKSLELEVDLFSKDLAGKILGRSL
jgi:F-type H+-transporting ATPase subunit b